MESIAYVARTDAVQDFATGKNRKEERRKQCRANDYRVHAIYAEYSASVPTIAGTLEKAKGGKGDAYAVNRQDEA